VRGINPCPRQDAGHEIGMEVNREKGCKGECSVNLRLYRQRRDRHLPVPMEGSSSSWRTASMVACVPQVHGDTGSPACSLTCTRKPRAPASHSDGNSGKGPHSCASVVSKGVGSSQYPGRDGPRPIPLGWDTGTRRTFSVWSEQQDEDNASRSAVA